MKRNKSLKGKIGLPLIILIIIILVQGLLSVVLVNQIDRQNDQINHDVSTMQDVKGILIAHHEWLSGIVLYVYTGQEFTGSLDYHKCSLGKWLDSDYVKNNTDPVVTDIINKIQGPHQAIHSTAATMIAGLDDGSIDSAQATKIFLDEIKPNSLATIKYLGELTTHLDAKAQASKNVLAQLEITIYIVSALITVFAIIIALFARRMMIKSIIPPIHRITEEAKNLALGKSVKDLDIRSEDEIGQLAAAFRSMSEAIQEQERAISAISRGDLNQNLSVRSDEDEISISLNDMTHKLNTIFGNILQASQQIKNSSNQLSAGAQHLAQGSTEQASAVQQMSATISEVSAEADKSTQTAQTASQLGDRMLEMVEEGAMQMAQLDLAVKGIAESSQAISQVIKVIDDISFQTNILALNAAVEAARAGAHGKGFAVVADEVRNLAGKSADAAKNVSELITDSITKAEEGFNIASKTKTSMEKIVEDIKESTTILHTITESSQIQSKALSEANVGLSQVTEVVHTNSATAEESAASSEELMAQSSTLESLVNDFYGSKAAGQSGQLSLGSGY